MAANASRLGEQSLVPNNEATGVVQPRTGSDQQPASTPELQESVTRPRLNKLTIPQTSVGLLESSSSRTDCSRESVFPPFPDPMQNRAAIRARNVVVFGESGVGKSSVINMIAGKYITQISNDAVGCTFQCQSYHILLDGLNVNLWDTIGLDEGTEGTLPAKQAEDSRKAFLRQITRWNGIDLLLYCIRGTRVRQALLRNYNIFYAAICRKKVPIALVITGLENYEGDMEGWWTEYEKDLMKHGMRFDAHACVTTLHSDHPAIQNRLEHSREVLRNLVQATFDAATWRADENLLMSASLPDARTLLQAVDKRIAPLIMICDATEQANRIRLFPPAAGSRAGCPRKYRCLYVAAREVLFGDPKLWTETAQRPDLLIFHADAGSEPDRTWTAFENFHLFFGGDMCPIIIVFGGLTSHEAAVTMWRLLLSSHSGEIIANPTYYPGPDGPRELIERADNALAALNEEKCLVKFEEKLTKIQKFCRHSKSFFPGR